MSKRRVGEMPADRRLLKRRALAILPFCSVLGCGGQEARSSSTQPDAAAPDASAPEKSEASADDSSTDVVLADDAAANEGFSIPDSGCPQQLQAGFDAGEGYGDPNDPDPLIGSWNYQGGAGISINATLTFRPDGTFVMVEMVAPTLYPIGLGPSTCHTTDLYLGTYEEDVDGGAAVLGLTFDGGMSNAIVGCGACRPGTPMTADAVAANRAQGLVPATSNTYMASSTTLVLVPTSGMPGPGLGHSPTTFNRLQ
jgi:hypothetical protein